MLLSLKTFFKEHKTATLQELALHFCKEPQIIRCMLEHWIRKGKICRLRKPSNCGTKCQLCQPQLFTEIYEWIEKEF